MITQEISNNKLIEANTSYSISKALIIQQSYPQELIELTKKLIETNLQLTNEVKEFKKKRTSSQKYTLYFKKKPPHLSCY